MDHLLWAAVAQTQLHFSSLAFVVGKDGLIKFYMFIQKKKIKGMILCRMINKWNRFSGIRIPYIHEPLLWRTNGIKTKIVSRIRVLIISYIHKLFKWEANGIERKKQRNRFYKKYILSLIPKSRYGKLISRVFFFVIGK